MNGGLIALHVVKKSGCGRVQKFRIEHHEERDVLDRRVADLQLPRNGESSGDRSSSRTADVARCPNISITRCVATEVLIAENEAPASSIASLWCPLTLIGTRMSSAVSSVIDNGPGLSYTTCIGVIPGIYRANAIVCR